MNSKHNLLIQARNAFKGDVNNASSEETKERVEIKIKKNKVESMHMNSTAITEDTSFSA